MEKDWRVHDGTLQHNCSQQDEEHGQQIYPLIEKKNETAVKTNYFIQYNNKPGTPPDNWAETKLNGLAWNQKRNLWSLEL